MARTASRAVGCDSSPKTKKGVGSWVKSRGWFGVVKIWAGSWAAVQEKTRAEIRGGNKARPEDKPPPERKDADAGKGQTNQQKKGAAIFRTQKTEVPFL